VVNSLIVESILGFIFGIINTILSPLGNIKWEFSANVLDGLFDALRVVFYIIPIKDLLPIIITFVALMTLRIAISLIKTIWDLLPLV
jgi:hypothetical protein